MHETVYDLAASSLPAKTPSCDTAANPSSNKMGKKQVQDDGFVQTKLNFFSKGAKKAEESGDVWLAGNLKLEAGQLEAEVSSRIPSCFLGPT
jgi:hypothetical protein